MEIFLFLWTHNINGQGDIALNCIVLYCIVLHCIALHCIALHCIVSIKMINLNCNNTYIVPQNII